MVIDTLMCMYITMELLGENNLPYKALKMLDLALHLFANMSRTTWSLKL